MKIIFWVGVIVSGAITIAGFAMTNYFTAPFDPPNLNAGGNGNAALFFVAFPFLIILFFFFQMMFVFEKIHERLSFNFDKLKTIYLLTFVLLMSYSIYRIIQFRQKMQPHFDYEIGYLTPFSNHLFFNFWTFLACLCISSLGSFYTKVRLKPVEINKEGAGN
ncbi:MAG: hypothetical protein RR642_10745 [Solibacillus sp.]